ncbi:MAG TPA: amidohydrolase family protein, partial [Conexibacter sp.]|nr:amidohydrolase family protein [Conexibacter sp.]
MSGDGRRCDLLLTGGTVVTVDDERRVIADGAVAIAGDRIVAVGAAGALDVEAARVVDCTGKALLPGFVDTHNHLFQVFARGLGEGLDGWSWLSSFMWPYAGEITTQDTLAAARVGAIESLRAGTTALLDHHYGCSDVATTLGVADVIERTGLRGVVARGIAGPLSDLGRAQGLPESSFTYTADEELGMTRECMEARPAGGRVAVWPGPINVVYTERELLRATVELARERGAGWHTHFCAPERDPGTYAGAYGVRPAQWLHDEGLLGPDATLAHATWLDDRDVQLLGSTHSCVAHCPISNQYMPYGVMRLRDLRDAGATVGLASDGGACGHRMDLLEQMKAAVLLQRVHRGDPQASSAAEALELATREGARMLGLDAGELTAGKLADVVVVDVAQAHLQPLHDVVASLVYAGRGGDVWMTVVGGEVVFADGRCTRIDEAAALADAAERAAALVRR